MSGPLRWVPPGRGPLTDLDWSDWIRRDDEYIDPYLVWADLSGESGFAGRHADGRAIDRWPLIVELSKEKLTYRYSGSDGMPVSGEDLRQRGCDVPAVFGVLQVPKIYLAVDTEAGCVGLSREYLPLAHITATVDPRQLRHLMCAKEISRFQLGMPRLQSQPFRPELEPPVQINGIVPRVVVGVIDDGFAFAHPRLLSAEGRMRARYLWDQGRAVTPDGITEPWHENDLLGYGLEMGPATLDDLMTRAKGVPQRTYELARYGRFRLDPQTVSTEPMDADRLPLPMQVALGHSHGHSVLDIAAGWPPVHLSQQAPLGTEDIADDEKELPSARPFDDARRSVRRTLEAACPSTAQEHRAALVGMDSADQWPLVLVQLPSATVADTSGGSLAVQVLDGLRYIVERATSIPALRGDGSPEEAGNRKRFIDNQIVVNISYGALGGGHDGDSILENAIERMVQASGYQLWVVLAAGNAHRAEAHASVRLSAEGSGTFTWLVGPDNPLESYLEVWLPATDEEGASLAEGWWSAVKIDISGPDGSALPILRCGEAYVLSAPDGVSPRAAAIFCRRVAQSRHGTMFLLAVAPTRVSDSSRTRRPVGLHGEWSVRVWRTDPASASTVVIHAWAERNDLVFGSSRAQQSRVYSDGPPTDLPEAVQKQRAAIRNQLRWPQLRGVPNFVPPRPALSSLASIQTIDPGSHPAVHSARTLGSIVVVGASRITDGEVSFSSSGGPSRCVSQSAIVAALSGAPDGADGHRIAPDVDAPGDVSPATAGIRTTGLAGAETTSRISGTSAAAAAVTRAVAATRFAWSQALGDSERIAAEEKASCLLFSEERPTHPGYLLDLGRQTLTPRADDAFRAGRRRARSGD